MLSEGRVAARQDLEEEHAERPDVHCQRRILILEELWCPAHEVQPHAEVLESRHREALLVLLEPHRELEVRQLDASLAREQHVAGVQVVVHQARLVQLAHGEHRLRGERQPLVYAQSGLALEPRSQALLAQLCCDVDCLLILPEAQVLDRAFAAQPAEVLHLSRFQPRHAVSAVALLHNLDGAQPAISLRVGLAPVPAVHAAA